MKSCLVIAGEKSGEEHALSFFNELRSYSPETHFYGVGGNELEKEGLELLYHLREFSSWGYSEVILKIPFYKKAFNHILSEVKKRKTKTAILIDFQSFNLKLASELKKNGVEVLYYVAPQAWAWKEYRVKKLKDSVHTLFTIIPFEKKWFQDRGVSKVISVDHPLLVTYKSELENFRAHEFKSDVVKILLLPGSRNFEVANLLPVFIEAVNILEKKIKVQVSIVKSTSVDFRLYQPFEKDFDKVYFNENLSQALKEADFSFASSGTVTLTCALFSVPTIVAYKTSLINQFIFETFVNYNWYISLANIVHNQLVFPELLQDQVDAFNFVNHFEFWYYNRENYLSVKDKLKTTKNLITGESIDIPQYLASVIKNSYVGID